MLTQRNMDDYNMSPIRTPVLYFFPFYGIINNRKEIGKTAFFSIFPILIKDSKKLPADTVSNTAAFKRAAADNLFKYKTEHQNSVAKPPC